jgi:LemA protein
MDTTMIILGIIGFLVLYFIIIYNSLIKLRTNVNESWSDIEVQMKRRYDLIPNLINTVKGYAKHEKETLDAVVKARAAAMDNKGSVESQAQDENMLTGALKSIFALSESYPDLKANENFVELQRELTDTEDKIQASRRFYNSNVREINIAVQVFPKNLIAKRFGFSKMEFFELDESEKVAAGKPVNVNFD